MSKHDPDLMDLAGCFIAAAGLPTTSNIYDEVADKCLSLLQPAVRLWKREGLIILGSNDVLIKCPLFQKLWDHAMRVSSKWPSITSTTQSAGVDEVHAESLTGSDVDKIPRKV